MNRSYSAQLFTRGFAGGAAWSLIVAIPFAFFVAGQLLNDYKHGQIDHLTDRAVAQVLTIGDIAWFGLGGIVYAACLILLPWATVAGLVRCLRCATVRHAENEQAL